MVNCFVVVIWVRSICTAGKRILFASVIVKFVLTSAKSPAMTNLPFEELFQPTNLMTVSLVDVANAIQSNLSDGTSCRVWVTFTFKS